MGRRCADATDHATSGAIERAKFAISREDGVVSPVFAPPPGRTDPSIIRNFCIIAHIDHGKSTLADRMLQLTGVVDERSMRAQYLDRMDIERERGITIKSQAVRMPWRFGSQTITGAAADIRPEHDRYAGPCRLHLRGIPLTGRLRRCRAARRRRAGHRGANSGQLYLALDADLHVIPVLNKIDLPSAQPDKYAAEMAKVIGCDPAEVLQCLGKDRRGCGAAAG